VEEVIKSDNFVLSMKHIKPRRKLRGSVETLFAVDFPGSQQKFVLMLDRRSKRGELVLLSFLLLMAAKGTATYRS
jgi:syndecan 4